MAKKEVKKSGLTPAQKVSVGVGLTAAAVAAAGAYFLYGSKNAAKNRKAVKSWMLKAKAEVLEKLEEAKEMSQEEFQEVVNNVAGAYSAVKSASKAEVKAFKDEMLESWKAIEKTAKPKKAAAKKAVAKKAPAKKAAK
jgi:6-phosphogluconolactonase (cycloisomerase 2 family)